MQVQSLDSSNHWVALAIGNSRLHWALFKGDRLHQTWHSAHLALDGCKISDWSDWQTISPAFQSLSKEDPFPELWIASVVTAQTQIWQTYPHTILLKLTDVPLQNKYPTLGLDRAITLWSAGTLYGWPTLVVDAGTALTLTGADIQTRLVGGAILPGLRLQLRSLHEETAVLPLVPLPEHLPEQWATETETAIQSGILYTAIAGLRTSIEQWCLTHPHSQVILTGGDAIPLVTYFREWKPQRALSWTHDLILDEQLLWKGIAALRQQLLPLSNSSSA
jgi:type III pantothenate kinase